MREQMPENVRLREDEEAVVIIDQTELPGRTVMLEITTAEQMFEAISRLRVRGAPAIGIFAAYGIYVLARSIRAEEYDGFLRAFVRYREYLDAARPTAVNLSWALRRMGRVVSLNSGRSIPEILRMLSEECRAIQREDAAMCKAISAYGLTLLKEGDGVLTHCNAGPLATSQYGTALGPILLAHERGMRLRVFADETRPLLQGARLTAYELQRAGVDVTLICDNMAGIVMNNGWINACFVGCDRIAANGDTANKIGTSVVAVLAKHYGIPFYVFGPSSSIDLSCPAGEQIEIEQRDPDEIREKFFRIPMAPEGVKCYNPAFDVTDHSLITAIITEYGICRPPFADSLKSLRKENGLG